MIHIQGLFLIILARKVCIPVKLATYSGVELATLGQVDNMVQDQSKRWFINN
jgi:hypothetical protein